MNDSNGRICQSDPPELFVGNASACTSTGDNPADYSFFWLVFTYLAGLDWCDFAACVCVCVCSDQQISTRSICQPEALRPICLTGRCENRLFPVVDSFM